MNTIAMSYSDLIEMKARNEGFKEGFKEGFREGFREGLKKAREEKVESVINMINDNYSDETILRYIKLSPEEVAKIREEHSPR